MRRKVGFIILGLGKMGMLGVLTILRIAETLRTRGYDLGVLIGVDPDPERRHLFSEISEDTFLKTHCADTFEDLTQSEAWTTIQDYTSAGGRIIVYDSSPSHKHHGHMIFAIQHGLFYFGEKPIIFDPNQISLLEQHNHCCNFVETQSSAFRTLRAWLGANEQFQFLRLRFWRFNTIGITRLVEPGRRTGVTGGALNDKLIHDLALAFGILTSRSQEIGTFGDINIDRIHFMLSNVPIGFMGLKGETLLQLPVPSAGPGSVRPDPDVAEALLGVHARYSLGTLSPVDLEFYAGWFGVSCDDCGLRKEMARCQHPWLFTPSRKRQSAETGIAYQEEEARVLILDGRLGDSKLTLTCNLLQKGGLRLWLEVASPDKTETIPMDDSLEFDNNALARVFVDVVECAAQPQREMLVGTEASRAVHRMLKTIREEIRRKPHNSDQELANSMAMLRKLVFLPNESTRQRSSAGE